MLEHKFDCLAVPLPPSFQGDVEAGIQRLPMPTMVVQKQMLGYGREWSAETDDNEDDEEERTPNFDPRPRSQVTGVLRGIGG